MKDSRFLLPKSDIEPLYRDKIDLCLKYGVVPDSFNHGILAPLLKKSTLDPTVPKSYRPVIISTVFTKLLEMYVLYESDQHIFSNYQFGFIRSRGTDTAISLVQYLWRISRE